MWNHALFVSLISYMEAMVVRGSVAEGITQRCYSSITRVYIYITRYVLHKASPVDKRAYMAYWISI